MADGPQPVPPGGLVAEFEFRMPVLPLGDYFVDASIAQGTQTDHVQLHWLHEARALQSRTTSVCTGLVGVPMRSISLEPMGGDEMKDQEIIAEFSRLFYQSWLETWANTPLAGRFRREARTRPVDLPGDDHAAAA